MSDNRGAMSASPQVGRRSPHVPHADWQSTRRLVDSNKYMLDNHIECDVTFALAGDEGEQIYVQAHKFVLISRSPVFFAMLSGLLAEKQEKIRITDISPDIFKQILGYLYCEDIHLTLDNVFSVLYTAKKYLVSTLTKVCIEYLGSQLGPASVCSYLENAFLFEEEETELYQSCMELVRQHSNKVFHSDTFYQISRETLCRILKVESLTIHEIDVFRACVHWASAQCSENDLQLNSQNKRQMLGDALKHIRFPTMSVDEFTKIVVPTSLLTMDEENAVFRYLLNPAHTSEPGMTSPFPSLSRECIECKCLASYEGYVKHTTYSSLYQGSSQRSKWSFSLYTDHTIKLNKISFLGKFKGTVHVTQNGLRKFEVTCHAHLSDVDLEDAGVSLDVGVFTIASEAPFSYVGEYYSRGIADCSPGVMCDQDKVTMAVKDASPLCFMASLVFVPSDEMHFVDNYFCSE